MPETIWQATLTIMIDNSKIIVGKRRLMESTMYVEGIIFLRTQDHKMLLLLLRQPETLTGKGSTEI